MNDAMTQVDFVGDLPSPSLQPAKIRKKRKSVQDNKDVLIAELERLVNKCPHGILNGSIQATREWMSARAEAAKLIKNPRASVNKLNAAVSRMTAFK